MSNIIESALLSSQETAQIDFKEHFDTSSKGDWCEVIKDIVAMANSGGGVLLFNVNDEGKVSGQDVSTILSYDPAKITDKIFSYTGRHFSEFNMLAVEKEGQMVAALEIGRTSVPLVFIAPGNYQGRDGKARSAFNTGTVYFRHGAKSEPGTSDDLQQFLHRELEIIKVSWLDGIRKVVEAPVGARIMIVPDTETNPASNSPKVIRLVDDPSVPANRLLNPDDTHPFRQIDIVRELNERLQITPKINNYDVLSVRSVYNISGIPRFYYKSQYSSAQYSQEFIDWIVEKISADNSFLEKAKANYHEITRERNSSWRKGK
ncbi:MAG: putative DNA binding domain-containing protein [Acidobacteria bacterium]|nr:putative DNA binding domain-containing protein [Acidobacteriota bacterium]